VLRPLRGRGRVGVFDELAPRATYGRPARTGGTRSLIPSGTLCPKLHDAVARTVTVNKVALPWLNFYNSVASTPFEMVGAVEDALTHAGYGGDVQAAKDLLPLENGPLLVRESATYLSARVSQGFSEMRIPIPLFGVVSGPGGGGIIWVGGKAGSQSSRLGNPLAGVSDAEIDAALDAPGDSLLMLRAPAPTSARVNTSGGMMVNEHTVSSTTSAAGKVGNAGTKVRVHTADPTAPPGGSSASGNTMVIMQGNGARRLVPGEGWVQTSTASEKQMNDSHIPAHR
jgi:hypothetical protein